MMKTLTSPSNSLQPEVFKSSKSAEDLGDDDLRFYEFIKPDLNKIDFKPSWASVMKILNYSKSV